MGGPYRAVNLKTVITVGSTSYLLVGVQNLDTNLKYEGEAEAYYGSRTRKQSAGVKTINFSLQRMFYTNTPYEDLFVNLFNDETAFTLTTSLLDKDGVDIAGTAVELTNCRIYSWKEVCGSANDIIGEEVTGESTDWVLSGVVPPTNISDVEGDYTGWTKSNNVNAVPTANRYAFGVGVDNNGIMRVEDESNTFIVTDGVGVTTISNIVAMTGFYTNFDYSVDKTVNQTYKLLVDENSDLLHVLKNEIDIATLTPDYGVTGHFDLMAISPNGKYVAVFWFAHETTGGFAQLFTGIGTDPASWDGSTLVGPQGPAGVSPTLEGDYTTWTAVSWISATPAYYINTIDETNNIMYMFGSSEMYIVNLITGVVTTETSNNHISGFVAVVPPASILSKYVVNMSPDDDDLKIYKNGVLIQTITDACTGTEIRYVSMSHSGKYIVAYTSSNAYVFVGS